MFAAAVYYFYLVPGTRSDDVCFVIIVLLYKSSAPRAADAARYARARKI